GAAVPADRQASAQGLMGAVELAPGAVSAVAAAWIYAAYGDTVVWVVAAISMAILLLIGAILTRPEDRQLVRPGVPSDPTRRPFQ
ncbi:MAG: hypothetical protein H8D48_02275, partial [Actinobacteria bacterium]|nr:hypothetical protein [Actinomycetota bacterium]